MSTVDLIITCRTPFGYKLDSNWLEQSCNRNSLWFSISGEFVTVSDGGECRRESEKEDERLFCYVMYSSGSTGKPKGVCGTEQALWNRFLWMQELYPLNGEEVLLFKTAISFVDHFQEFLNAILTGSALVIPPFNQLKRMCSPLWIFYSSGGVVLASRDGKIVRDNTLNARLNVVFSIL